MKSYYASVSGYCDELLWAALWLHRATGGGEEGSAYLDYAIKNAGRFGGTGWGMTEFSWDVKYAGLQILASKVNTSSFFLSSIVIRNLWEFPTKIKNFF